MPDTKNRPATCATCRWWDPTSWNGAHGQCRRAPPVYTAQSIPGWGAWMATSATDWCGEWKERGDG
jgi:hypothetical protein